MRKNVLILLLAICITSITYAAPGDTTIIQTFTFADGTQIPRTGKFEFPDGSIEYEKVLMYYTVKCDNSKPSPYYCGEWDNDVYTDVYKETGQVDTANNPIYDIWRIGTYVTPYGEGIDLGNGWTYILDVTDFLPLLKDSVLLRDGNGQELVDLKFVFIEGKPVRNVVNIRKVWSSIGFSVEGYLDGFPLSMFDQDLVKDTTFPLSANEKQVKLRATLTGHNFGEGNNCGEFCPNIHSIQANGTTVHQWQIVQECATNPMYPQGGPWIYDRAGWCPGMMATTNHFELTPYIQNDSINFDYDITYDPYKGVYHTFIFLVTYGDNNHTDDVSAETIIAPTDNPLYLRYNPTSGEPIIVIKNIGSNPLTSVEIKYGFKNGTQNTYQWTGNLSFLKMDTIKLPVLNWDEVVDADEKIFQFELLSPNGETDPTPYNNKLSSSFQMPPVLTVNAFQFVFKTNHAPNETSWKLFDMNNTILYQSSEYMSANTEYTTNMKLKNGSYRLYIDDTGNDGLSFPFYYGDAGSAVLKKRSTTNSTYTPFYAFNPDFGKETQFHFIVNQPIEDTTIIQIFTFADGTQTPRTGKFEFPDGSIEYEKVLMYYTVKCDNSRPSPYYCGQWDYDVHTDVLKETGLVDAENNPIHDVWRIGTYITPYGGGIDLGNGWTYILDVTDFLPLLKDSVLLRDGNGQELVDLKFVFIKGKPARNVINIRKVWSSVGFSVEGYQGGFPLSMFDQDFVKDTTFPLSVNEKQVKLRTTVTGHNFYERRDDGTDNGNYNGCGEFCPNIHSIQANGTTIHQWQIIQECATNSIYDQGGTWIYDRAGWCPGMMATTNHFELTPYVQNDSINFDYDITYDPYKGVYRAYIFLVTYGDNNHTDDVSAETIIAPTDNPLYLRYNPMCGEPVVVIKNIGSNPLTSVEVKYGFKNGTQNTYQWKGNLPFLKMDTITLPIPNWDEVANADEKIFQFELLSPNGTTDPTPYNNKQSSSFQMPPVLTVNALQFVFRTNYSPNETSWKLFDMNNSILYQSQGYMSANTEYTTNMELKNGSYRLYMYDTREDGLSYPFYGNAGSAVLKRKMTTGSLYTPFYAFNPNFGKETQFYFAINQYAADTSGGDDDGIQEINHTLQDLIIFPNPVQSTIYVEMSNIQGKDNMTAKIYDMFGKHIMSKEMISSQLNEINVEYLAAGVYIITVEENGKLVRRNKFVISK